MVALARFTFGETPIPSAKLNAVIDALTGAANTPVSTAGVNDPVSYSLTVRNQDTAGKGLVVYAADGSTVLLQVQNSGVRASAGGGAASSIVTTDDTQTLTNKTLNNPAVTGTLSGTLSVGVLTASGLVTANSGIISNGALTVVGAVLTAQAGFTVSGGNINLGASGSNLGFFGATNVLKQTVTGSRGGNAALAVLLTSLANYGLITDSTTA